MELATETCCHHWMIEDETRADGLWHGFCILCDSRRTWPVEPFTSGVTSWSHLDPQRGRDFDKALQELLRENPVMENEYLAI